MFAANPIIPANPVTPVNASSLSGPEQSEPQRHVVTFHPSPKSKPLGVAGQAALVHTDSVSGMIPKLSSVLSPVVLHSAKQTKAASEPESKEISDAMEVPRSEHEVRSIDANVKKLLKADRIEIDEVDKDQLKLINDAKKVSKSKGFEEGTVFEAKKNELKEVKRQLRNKMLLKCLAACVIGAALIVLTVFSGGIFAAVGGTLGAVMSGLNIGMGGALIFAGFFGGLIRNSEYNLEIDSQDTQQLNEALKGYTPGEKASTDSYGAYYNSICSHYSQVEGYKDKFKNQPTDLKGQMKQTLGAGNRFSAINAEGREKLIDYAIFDTRLFNLWRGSYNNAINTHKSYLAHIRDKHNKKEITTDEYNVEYERLRKEAQEPSVEFRQILEKEEKILAEFGYELKPEDRKEREKEFGEMLVAKFYSSPTSPAEPAVSETETGTNTEGTIAELPKDTGSELDLDELRTTDESVPLLSSDSSAEREPMRSRRKSRINSEQPPQENITIV